MNLLPKTKTKTRGFRRDLRPEDITVHTCTACKWIKGVFSQGAQYQGTIGKIQRLLHSFVVEQQEQTKNGWQSVKLQYRTSINESIGSGSADCSCFLDILKTSQSQRGSACAHRRCSSVSLPSQRRCGSSEFCGMFWVTDSETVIDGRPTQPSFVCGGWRDRTDDHAHGDDMKDSNLSQCAYVCEDENTTTLPKKMRTTLSGCGCKCTHRKVPRKHRCCHWRSYRGVSRKHRCCHWHSRCALSPSHRFSTFLKFHFVSKFSSCCHAVAIHQNFHL